jgi:hypothetical protein
MNESPLVPGLKSYGPGISESQAELISSFIRTATSAYQDDKFNNAIYIQDVMEQSVAFSGMWTVEIVESAAAKEWKLAGEVHNNQWFMVSNFGDYGWTYRVWTPNC